MHQVREKRKAENEKEKMIHKKIISNLQIEETAKDKSQSTTEEDKAKNIDNYDNLPELINKELKMMNKTMFQTLKSALLVPLEWIQNKCCNRRSQKKDKKKN